MPADVVEETEELLIFEDIMPKAPVHLLVVPKKHIMSVRDMDKDDVGLMGRLIFAARDAAEKFNLEGYKLLFNVGRKGGQIVDHIHLHILGGWNENQAG